MPCRIGAMALTIALLLAACGSDNDEATGTTESALSVSSALSPATCRGDTNDISTGRTDVLRSGNRRAPGTIDLLSAPVTVVDLATSATWVVPYFVDPEACDAQWYVTLDDGQAVIVDAAGNVAEAGAATAPPETEPGSVESAHAGLDQFDNPLPDSRVVTSGPWSAALVNPTDRYGHGVLGDRIEAGAVQVVNAETDERIRIVIDAPSVIEGLSPMLIDVDQEDGGVPEVLVTLSNADVGAWLALYNIDGTLRAESTPIGQGNRWRNQLAAGWTGPSGDYEIVDVRTPHLDGVVEFFRVDGDRLERTASISGYTNHTLGSRNLDLGILVDADADKIAEVLLPTRDLRSLAIIDRVGDEAVELGRIDLDAALTTNIASQWLLGQAWIAFGTSDGRLVIIGDPLAGVSD